MSDQTKEKKQQAIAVAIKKMIDTPRDVTEKERKEETQRDANDIRNRERPEGRYSINETIVLLLAETGEYFRVGKATWDGELRAYAPGSLKPIDTSGNDPKKWMTYNQAFEVCWNDINDWLKENYPLVKYKFPNPDTASDTVKNAKLKPIC